MINNDDKLHLCAGLCQIHFVKWPEKVMTSTQGDKLFPQIER